MRALGNVWTCSGLLASVSVDIRSCTGRAEKKARVKTRVSGPSVVFSARLPPESLRVTLLPKHLAEAIEWILRPPSDARGKAPPDLSRLTSEQMQLLPLPVAQAFMDLTLAALQPPSRGGEQHRHEAPKLWIDPRSKQRARRVRQRADALGVARQRLYAWYVQTASAQQRGIVR